MIKSSRLVSCVARGAQRQPFASLIAYDQQPISGETDASELGAFSGTTRVLIRAAAYLLAPNRLARPYTRGVEQNATVSYATSALARHPFGLLVPPSRHRPFV